MRDDLDTTDRIGLGGDLVGYRGLVPMPDLRNATPAQRTRAIVAFVVALVVVIVVLALVMRA